MIRKFSEVERNENKEVLGSLRRYRQVIDKVLFMFDDIIDRLYVNIDKIQK